MNKVTEGRVKEKMRSKYEIRAQKELEAEGWLVDNKAGMGRHARNRDFWNLFDLVCVKRRVGVRYISIKGLKGIPSDHRKQIKDFWLPAGCSKEIWARSQSSKKYWNKIVL